MTARGILNTILAVQPKESGGGGEGETREAVVRRLADDMLAKLPPDYPQHEVLARLARMGAIQPMTVSCLIHLSLLLPININISGLI